MPLSSGSKLGPYEIIAPLGAGGMGEVYRARDTRLDRTVAIKVLPPHLSQKTEARQRLEREARAISALSHPHICALYDIGQQDGTDYLVMEYLEGETLAQRLTKGPLLLEQVLQYATEIADALDKAHRKGVTHRDLKPGNIMLTKTGTKLLDFGLAKLKPETGPPAALSELPTAEDTLSAQGTILGTLQYMAPEQLEGKEVDARTDIFAFGAVLYEMVTGKRAFEGKSQASVIAAILERDPPAMSTLQPMTPPVLDRVVKKCLAKEPEKRWQGASDLCDELKWILEGGSQVTLAPTAPAKGIRALGRRALILSLGTLLLGAAIASLAVWILKPTPPRPVTRTVIALPPGERLAGLDQPAVVLSPDGSYLVYVATRGGIQQLYLRAMARLAKGEFSHRWPEFLPGGKAVLFAAGGAAANWTNAQVAVQSVGTGERRDLIQGATHPRYAPSGPTAIASGRQAGHLVYAQGGNLTAVPFDPQRLELTGTAVPVLEGVLQSPSSGAAQYSFSATGSLVHVSGPVQAAQRLVWVNRSGAEQPLASPARAYRYPRLSPDGRRVAATIDEQETQVWILRSRPGDVDPVDV